MRSLLNPTLHGLCLLAAISSSGLWARSYFVADQYTWTVQSARSGFHSIHSRAVQTTPGRLVFQDRTALM